MAPTPALRQVAAQDASKYGLGQWFVRQIQQESNFDPHARSGAGAEGIAQFEPATARGVGLTNPYDPIASLDAAARFDANLVHQYGSVPRALSAYNSGRPDAYLDPGFAKGQTYNYVKSILGGSPTGAAPHATATPAPALPSHTGTGGPSPIAAALKLLGFNAPANFGAGPTAPSIAPIPSHAPVLATPPMQGPPRIASLDGIQVDQRIAPEVANVIKQFAVTPTSGYRSPSHNAAVGGVENSDHLRGDAVDFSGTPQQLQTLYRWALQQHFPYVEPMAQAKNHVHISFSR